MEIKDLISIIVPVYNVEDFLQECIKSILQQTYQNYELILIDDGSTDGSWEIINTYASKYKKIIAFKKENEGVNSARKKGLDLAKGEYVMFVDADDYVNKYICEKLLCTIKAQQVDVVLSKMIKILNNVEIGFVGNWSEEKCLGSYAAENFIDVNIFYKTNLIAGFCAHLYKTKIVKNIFKVLDIRIAFSEDCSALWLILLDSKYIYFLDEYLYYYRQRNNSITHKYINSDFNSQKYLYRFMCSELKKRQASAKLYKQLEWLIIRNLLLDGYEIFKEKRYLYPFKNVQKGSDIVIYGAGLYGQNLFHFIKQYHICNVVMWIDQNWKLYQESEYPVSKVEDIDKTDYDYIVIAVMNPDVASEIREKLQKRGIALNRISLINQELIAYKELPDIFWEMSE